MFDSMNVLPTRSPHLWGHDTLVVDHRVEKADAPEAPRFQISVAGGRMLAPTHKEG